MTRRASGSSSTIRTLRFMDSVETANHRALDADTSMPHTQRLDGSGERRIGSVTGSASSVHSGFTHFIQSDSRLEPL